MSALVVLILIAVLALITVSIANHRETRRRLIKVKLKNMKVQLDELEELLTEIDIMLESRAIARRINQHIIRHIEGMLQLDPQTHYLEAALENAEKRAVILADEGQNKAINRVRNSDSRIAKAKRALEEAGKILQAQLARSEIGQAELEAFSQELSWTYLMIDVLSLIAEGHKAVKTNPTRSYAYYQSAKNILARSKSPDPRRNELLRQVTDLMTRKRSAISEDLMPETDYNPDTNAPESNAS